MERLRQYCAKTGKALVQRMEAKFPETISMLLNLQIFFKKKAFNGQFSKSKLRSIVHNNIFGFYI